MGVTAPVFQVWGVQNVRPVLTPARWGALISASRSGAAQGLYSGGEAARLLAALCALSTTQVRQ